MKTFVKSKILGTSVLLCLGHFLVNDCLGLEDTTSLHSLEVCVSIIVGIKVLVSLLPGLVDSKVPRDGGDGRADCGLDQDALDLVDVHPPHNGLGNGGDSRHGSCLDLYSLVEVNQAIL